MLMIKSDIFFKSKFLAQVGFGMAPFTQTGPVADLARRFYGVSAGHILDHRDQAIDLASNGWFNSRFIVAQDTTDVFMGGMLPCLGIGFHVMTLSTESGVIGYFYRIYRKQYSSTDQHDH